MGCLLGLFIVKKKYLLRNGGEIKNIVCFQNIADKLASNLQLEHFYRQFCRRRPLIATKLYFCIVKFLTLLFAVYILLLPVLPCMDGNECRPTTTAAADHRNQEQKEETCNPFCSCPCCLQAFTPAFEAVKPATHGPLTEKTNYLDLYTIVPSRAPGTIWQPPRLV